MSDDLARLGLQVDSTQAAKASGDLDNLAASAGRAEAATGSLADTSKSATASLRDVGTASSATKKATDELRAAYASGAAVTSAQIQAAGGWAAAQKIMQEANAATTRSEQIKATTVIGAERAIATAAVESAAIQAVANDHVVGSSLKIRESLVLLREASVGNFTRMAGSASILLGAFGLMNAILIPLGVALAVTGGAIALATNQINSGAHGTGDLAKGLGLTAEQLERVKDRYVTLGDTAKATLEIIWEAMAGPSISKAVQSTWNWIADFIYNAMVITTGAVQGGVNAIVEAWKAMPKALGGEGSTAGIDFSKAFKKGMDDTRAQFDKFYSDIAERARKNARDRMRAEAGKAGGGSRVDDADRATGQLKQLQDETAAQIGYNNAVMNGTMTVAEFARQESIDNGVKALVVKYNADIAAGTAKSKLEADKLLPLINDLKVAYGQAYDTKIISQQLAANDNMANQNALLEMQIGLAGKTQELRDYEIAQLRTIADLQRRRIEPNSFAGQQAIGVAGDAVTKHYDLQRSSLLNDAPDSGTRLGTSAAKATLASDPATYIKQQKAAYDEINALRQQDVLSETQAAQAKAKVDADIMKQRLAWTDDFFGNLASLSQSSNKELATIGKAAAVSKASIDAYLAINNALATIPFPANIAVAASIGVAAFANVAQIEGFATGVVGISGPGTGTSDSILARLSNGESVVTADATAKNRNTLAMMNEGAGFDGMLGRAANSNRGMNVEVHNYAGVRVQTEQLSEDRVRVLIHEEAPSIVKREAPKAVASSQRDPNGIMAKATRDTVNAKRKRR